MKLIFFLVLLCLLSHLVPMNYASEYEYTIDVEKEGEVIPSALFKGAKTAYKLNLHGLKALEINRLDKALDYFEKASGALPNYTDAINNIGVIYFRKGNIMLAKELWKKAVTIDHEYSIGYHNLGMAAFYDKKLLSARDYFLQALKNDKRFTEVLVMLGKIELTRGNNIEALSHLKKAYRIDPKSEKVWGNLAYGFIQNNDTLNAIKILVKNKISVKALTMLGQIEASRLHNKKAIEYFNSALAKKKDSALLLEIVKVQYESHQFKSAYKNIKNLLKTTSNPSADAWLLGGLCAKECESIYKTKQYFQKGLYYYPHDQIMRFNLGQIHFYQRDFKEALKIWASLSDTINDPALFHLKAIAAYKENDTQLAKSCIKKAIIIDSKAEYYDLLGILLHEGGNDIDASKQFKKALSLNASLRSAQLNLAIIDNKQDRISALITSMKKQIAHCVESCPEKALQLSILYYYKHYYQNAIEVLINIPDKERTLSHYRHLALFYRATTDWENAIQTLEHAKKRFDLGLQTSYELAESYLQAGLYTKAIVILKQCIRQWNKNPWRLYYQVGYAFAKNNNFRESRKYLEKSLKKNKKTLATRGLLAFVYNELGEREKAKGLWEKTLKDDPTNSILWINLGLLLEAEGKYEEAIEKYTRALLEDPPDNSVYINIGNTYALMGYHDKSLTYYTRALNSKKRNVAAYNVFLAAKRLSDKTNAESAIGILKKEFPKSLYTKRAISELLLWSGDTSAAHISFENLPDKNAFDWYSLAQIYLHQKNYSSFEHAIKNIPNNIHWIEIKKRLKAEQAFIQKRYNAAFLQWQDLKDDSYYVRYNKALSAFYAERYDVAINIGKTLLEQSDGHDKVSILNLLGNATIKTKDWKQAQSYFLSLVEIKPKDPIIFYNLAVITYNNDAMVDSWRWYKKAQKIDPKIVNADIENRYRIELTAQEKSPLNDIDILYNQAVALQKSEHYSAAEKLYRQILRKNGKHCLAWNNLGAIYGERAELQKAIHCYKNAVTERTDVADGFANLVNIYIALKHIKLAERWLEKGIKHNPQSVVLKKMQAHLHSVKNNQ